MIQGQKTVRVRDIASKTKKSSPSSESDTALAITQRSPQGLDHCCLRFLLRSARLFARPEVEALEDENETIEKNNLSLDRKVRTVGTSKIPKDDDWNGVKACSRLSELYAACRNRGRQGRGRVRIERGREVEKEGV